jgi:hypothetical protein
MNKEKTLNKLLDLLYEVQLKDDELPDIDFKNLADEIGVQALHETIQFLRNKGWTKYNSILYKGENIRIINGYPILSQEAIEYVKFIKKPWFKKNQLLSVFYNNFHDIIYVYR